VKTHEIKSGEIEKISENHFDAGLPTVESEGVDGGEWADVGVHVTVDRKCRRLRQQSKQQKQIVNFSVHDHGESCGWGYPF
jgi:hypothetical protein